MTYYVYGNELYHYGIPGMRWGHRKGPDTSNGSSKPRYGSEEYYRNKANSTWKSKNIWNK